MKRIPVLLSVLLVSGTVLAQTAAPPPSRDGGHDRWREHAEQKFG